MLRASRTDRFRQLTSVWAIAATAIATTFATANAQTTVPLPGELKYTNWAQWRGPLNTGSAPDAATPVEFSEDRNVRWKTPLPGRGHATPVVWQKTIFLTSSIPVGEELPPKYSGAPGAHDNLPVTHRHQFVALAVHRDTGKILWQKTLAEELPHAGAHYTGSLASNSPATDGKHLYAYFGSFGLFCLDFDGNLVWKKTFGRMQTKHGHGEGSSPVLHGDSLVINWDHEKQSFLVALDKLTGAERWRVAREEVTSWSTPIVVEDGARDIIVVCGTNRVRGYDLANGAVVWECGGLSANIVASPVADKGVVYVGSSYDSRALMAIKYTGAKGDLTDSKRVLWRRSRGTPYVPSLLLHQDHLFFLTHYQGILTKINARSGEDAPGSLRLGGIRNIYASPIATKSGVYVTDLEGNTMVISNSEIPRVLALNHLEDSFSASAAVTGNAIILRGAKHLYCIEETP